MSNLVALEGANGGSFVEIEETETEGQCHIRVGHSCVVTVNCELPVTWLAAILTHAKNIGFENAMGERDEFPADYAIMCDPSSDKSGV